MNYFIQGFEPEVMRCVIFKKKQKKKQLGEERVVHVTKRKKQILGQTISFLSAILFWARKGPLDVDSWSWNLLLRPLWTLACRCSRC